MPNNFENRAPDMSVMKQATFIFVYLFLAASADIWQTGSRLSGNWYQKELQQVQQVPPHQVTAYKLQRYFLGRPVRTKRETTDDAADNSWTPLEHLDQELNSLKHEEKKSQASSRISKRSYHEEEYYDVVYIIDASGSIKENEFQEGLKALEILTSRARQSTIYAAIAFSEQGHVQFAFQPPYKTIKLLESTKYYGFRTNTQDALKKCREDLFLNKTSGVREGSLKRVLIVTDGRSNFNKETTLYQALELKFLEIEVFVVAVGKYIDGIEELMGIATTRERHLFRVDSLGGFIKVVQLIPPWPAAIRSNL